MVADAVICLTRLVGRVNVYYGQRQIVQVMKQLVTHFRSNCVSLTDRHLGIDRDINFRV